MSSLALALGIAAFLIGAVVELACSARTAARRRARWRPPVAAARRGPHSEEFYPRRRAQLRALALLKQWLSSAQRGQYQREGHFDVVGSASGIRYRIHHGTQFNVEELDADGVGIAALCFAPEGSLAAGDVMLAQKIALETNEVAAIGVANRIGPPDEFIRSVASITAARSR
jgi:hypothetical protein